MSALERWRQDLDAWAIPPAIMAGAEESPWIHPPVLFDVPDQIPSSRSHDLAREALGDEASVLDVGCGGGIAAFALVPRVKKVIGVDHQPEMLTMFERNAEARHLECQTLEGFWPSVAANAPLADVVTAHHVVYNVGDIAPFIEALDRHARTRVVLELPTSHPLSPLNEAWKYFWDLERPQAPTPDDLMDVLGELGLHPSEERWEGALRVESDINQAARFTRVRLCLPASREAEVRDFLIDHPGPPMRQLATIWWDK